MISSVLRELTLLAEENDAAANGEHDDEDDEDEEDNDEEDFDEGHHRQLEDNDSDDDAINPADQAYLRSLRSEVNADRVRKYMGGELVDEDDDDNTADMISPVQTIDTFDFFFQALEHAIQREPEVNVPKILQLVHSVIVCIRCSAMSWNHCHWMTSNGFMSCTNESKLNEVPFSLSIKLRRV